jgi:hypothetical protein
MERRVCPLFPDLFKLPIPEGLEKLKHDLEYYIVAMSRDKIEGEKMAKSIMKNLSNKKK